MSKDIFNLTKSIKKIISLNTYPSVNMEYLYLVPSSFSFIQSTTFLSTWGKVSAPSTRSWGDKVNFMKLTVATRSPAKPDTNTRGKGTERESLLWCLNSSWFLRWRSTNTLFLRQLKSVYSQVLETASNWGTQSSPNEDLRSSPVALSSGLNLAAHRSSGAEKGNSAQLEATALPLKGSPHPEAHLFPRHTHTAVRLSLPKRKSAPPQPFHTHSPPNTPPGFRDKKTQDSSQPGLPLPFTLALFVTIFLLAHTHRNHSKLPTIAPFISEIPNSSFLPITYHDGAQARQLEEVLPRTALHSLCHRKTFV